MAYLAVGLACFIGGLAVQYFLGPDLASHALYAENLVKAKFELAVVRMEASVQKGEMDAKGVLTKIKALL